MKLEEFKKTQWYLPTVRRYKEHLAACRKLECPELIVPFWVFIAEIIDEKISDKVRADMLQIMENEPYEAFCKYEQYTSPTEKI